MSTYTPVTLAELTTATTDGTGAFDVLMRANKSHLEQEFLQGRIKGNEYATVYLGSLQKVLEESVKFLLQKELQRAELDLKKEQVLNAQIERAVLLAQECKLRAEFDLIREQILKTAAETALINQRKLTEQAQITGMGVDVDSVIGRQKALYEAQTNGFQRDAEQKTADLLIKSWATRRTTDEATVADAVNMLNDVTIGRAVNKMLTGVGA